MSFADLAERHDDFFVPAFEVRIGTGGGSFPSENVYTGDQGLISDLRVDTDLGRANRFSFTLNDVFDRQKGKHGEFDEAVRSTFAEGTDVEIGMGYGTNGAETLLRGRIETVKPNFPARGAPSLSVEGRDLVYLLRNGTGTGNWEETDLTTVIEDLISDTPFAGTEVDIDDGSITSLHHPETSDFDFIQQLADRNDAEFFSRAGTFHFRGKSVVSDQSSEATLTYGQALRSFTPGSANPRTGSAGSRANRSRVGTVKVRHNDEKKKEAIVGTAEVTGGGEKTHVETIPVRSQAEAERHARSIAGEIERQGTTGGLAGGGTGGGGSGNRAETIGLPEIQIGRVIELAGLGSEYSGRYHVESAAHRIDDSGYTTSFGVRKLNNE